MSAQNQPETWSAGAVIGNRYRLVKLIGAGAMAEVWEAEHVTLQTPAALKLVSVALDARPEETLERFMREAQAAAKLRSPHVVQILDHGTEGASAYLAMERLTGESLRQLLLRQAALEPLEVARIVSQLARGLETAHAAGIVHRDLKPENIFLARDAGGVVVKVLDFGIAKRIDLQGVDRLATQDGFMVGTPCYMSPEQVLGTERIDARSDLWQVAIVAFECLCGQRPFDASAVGELIMTICSGPLPVPSRCGLVPPGFDAWFAKAAARDPHHRFQSATEMAEALVAVLAPHTTAAALASSLPAWVPPAASSSPGLLDQSYPGIFDASSSVNRLGTTSRQTWASQRQGALGLAPHRALLTLVLIALPVAILAGSVGIWVLTSSPSAPSGPAASSGEVLAPGGPGAGDAAAVAATANASTSGPPPASSAAELDRADAGSPRPVPTASQPWPRPGALPAERTPAPRSQRPEDVLGI